MLSLKFKTSLPAFGGWGGRLLCAFCPILRTLSTVSFVCLGSSSSAYGSQLSKKAHVLSPFAPSGKFTSLKLECLDLVSRSNSFTSKSLFLFSRTCTFVWSKMTLSSAVEILVSASVTRPAQSVMSFLTLSIADNTQSNLVENSVFM